jgi:hypothetical protein
VGLATCVCVRTHRSKGRVLFGGKQATAKKKRASTKAFLVIAPCNAQECIKLLKITSLSEAKKNSLPLMFGGNLKRRVETRRFNGFLGLYSMVIYGLGKKIGCRKVFGLLMKLEEFFGILSFYQVYESLPNNLQTHQQGV